MKKLATLVAVCTLSIAAPVFACPHADKAEADARTAEKTDKSEKKTDTVAKDKQTDKTEKAPAKAADGAKKAVKVSSK